MNFVLLIFTIFLNASITGVPHEAIDYDYQYIDRIAIIKLVLESYTSIPENDRDNPMRIGLHNRFENQSVFDEIRCRDLRWGTAYCDLFNVVRFYDKMRFLNTKWFDFQDRATLHLMESPNFSRVEIYYHFSPIAINYTGKKAVVMVQIDEDQNNSKGFIIGLEKNKDWDITLKHEVEISEQNP